jgi:hypothetical protein
MLGLTTLGTIHTAISLIALAAGFVARTVGFSLALFLHFIPGTVETLVRLPMGAPYLSSPLDPKAQPILGFFFLLFLIGATLQVLRLRSARDAVPLLADEQEES